MGMYNQGLNFLDRALSAGAISGEDALSQLLELDAAKREQRQARQAAELEARQAANSTLSGYALEAAGDPSTLQDVLRLANAETTFPTDPRSALDMLFLPAQGRNQGLSRIDPTLPTDNEQDIFNIVRDEYAAGNIDPNSIRQIVEDALGYGPKTTGRLGTDIDPIFQKALEAARGY